MASQATLLRLDAGMAGCAFNLSLFPGFHLLAVSIYGQPDPTQPFRANSMLPFAYNGLWPILLKLPFRGSGSF